MICPTCGAYKKDDPVHMSWMFKVIKGDVVSRLFEASDIPKGWYDSPKKAQMSSKKETKQKDTQKKETLSLNLSSGE